MPAIINKGEMRGGELIKANNISFIWKWRISIKGILASEAYRELSDSRIFAWRRWPLRRNEDHQHLNYQGAWRRSASVIKPYALSKRIYQYGTDAASGAVTLSAFLMHMLCVALPRHAMNFAAAVCIGLAAYIYNAKISKEILLDATSEK